MRIFFTRLLTVCVLLLWTVSILRAQDATPEITVEPTSESTPESTAEATPDLTPEATSEPEPAFPGVGSYTVRHTIDGIERRYRVYIPKSYDAEGEATSLMIVMHGAGGDGAGTEAFTGFNELAEENGFVVIYPDGLGSIWNDGRVGDSRVGSQDDVKFIGRAISFMLQGLNIDPAKVYATGYSMGGMMSYRLACALPARIAAIASVASTFPEYLLADCDKTPPIPVLVIQGTDDPVVPWVGARGGYLSAINTLIFWQDHNGCQTKNELETVDDVDPEDGTRVIVEGYTDCKDSADVQIYGVFNGGHTWPGHPIEAPFDLGRTSLDIDATHIISEFFREHVKGA